MKVTPQSDRLNRWALTEGEGKHDQNNFLLIWFNKDKQTVWKWWRKKTVKSPWPLCCVRKLIGALGGRVIIMIIMMNLHPYKDPGPRGALALLPNIILHQKQSCPDHLVARWRDDDELSSWVRSGFTNKVPLINAGCESWKARMEKLPGNHIDELINPRADQKKLRGNRILWKMNWSWEFWWLSHHRNSCLQLSRLVWNHWIFSC